MSGADPEMQAVVCEELAGSLDELLELLEELEQGTQSKAEVVRRAFRIFHNAKGALRLGGFPEPEIVAHLVEDRLSELRSHGGTPSPEFVALMRDALAAALRAAEASGDDPELRSLVERLQSIGAVASRAPSLAPVRASSAPARSGPEPQRALAVETRDAVRVDAARLDRLMGLGSEYLAQHARQAERKTALRGFADRLLALSRTQPSLRSVLSPLSSEFEALVRAEERELRRVSQLTADFDFAMREVRMQPLAVVAAQLRRVVSETSRELGKSAHLTLSLGNVELDRQVIDALREPLAHLLRNALDHGLERPEERERAGKPPRGEIQVSARVRGAAVEIEVSDDGRGIDPGRVLTRALELELVPNEDAARDPAFIDSMLFAPGFSTARTVTNVSGRGVGLDVVRSRVTELGGQVGVVPRAQGACFNLSVPTSMVSLRGLAVDAGKGTFVIPSTQVQRTLRVKTEQVKSAEGSAVITTPEGDPLRLRWLSAAMGQPRGDDPRMLNVVVVADGVHRHGLVVDEIQGDTSFVIKRLPWNVRRTPGVIGATHQGDASLALVVDVTHLFRVQSGNGDDRRVQAAPRRAARRILVADDSLTSRTLERNILTGAGYEVEVVVDGDAALRALENGTFDLVVSDVQMPGLDGIALTRRIRATSRLSHLPVILVTSLDRPEDVAEGARAGANEYIVKGRFDQRALLEAVSRLI
jgi:two-component system chemotaxis sensor kinase CheA